MKTLLPCIYRTGNNRCSVRKFLFIFCEECVEQFTDGHCLIRKVGCFDSNGLPQMKFDIPMPPIKPVKPIRPKGRVIREDGEEIE